MPKCCILCSAVASPDLQLLYCSVCQSAMYCSKACQTKDWKTQHKQLCKLVNVGRGDMQMRSIPHTSRFDRLQGQFERNKRNLHEDAKGLFKLFQESTFEGSQAAALKMKKIAKRQTKHIQRFLLFHSLQFLIRSNSEMLSWPNSPLLVMLEFVDVNMLSVGKTRVTALHHLAGLASPFDYSTHVNQLILAKQLIDRGANVNALSSPPGETPLHAAFIQCTVTNLDFVELLLEKGADPNLQDHSGKTPLMLTAPFAPGAAKFLLNRPTTDANLITICGASFLARARYTIKAFSDQVAWSNPGMVQNQFSLRQWREIEEILVERGALDTVITGHS
jgi:hypothetical protein